MLQANAKRGKKAGKGEADAESAPFSVDAILKSTDTDGAFSWGDGGTGSAW